MSSTIARHADCTDCPLHESARHVCLMGKGPAPAQLMIIGEAPGREEDRLGQPFVGPAGKLLDELLRKAEFDPDKIYITNAVKCRPPENRAPSLGEIRACAQHLQREIDAVKPQYVLLLGNIPLKSVLNRTGIMRQRGRATHHGSCIVMPTVHPAAALYSEANYPVIQFDLRYLRKVMQRGSIPREHALRPLPVDTPSRVDELVEALTGIVSFDIETSPKEGSISKKDGLYPWNGQVTALGFGTSVGEFTLQIYPPDRTVWNDNDIDAILARVIPRLSHCFVVGQNIKFDQLWMLVHFGVRIEADFDTMLAHYLLNENHFHDLEYLARQYFNAPAWDIPLEAKQGATTPEQLSVYLAHDLYYTRQLFFELNLRLKRDRRLYKLYQHLLMPLSNLFVQIEANGVFLDEGRFKDAEIFLKRLINAARDELNNSVPQSMLLAALTKLKMNWSSTKDIGRLFFRTSGFHFPLKHKTKTGLPSTAESALNEIDHPIIAKLKRYRAARQELSFFIKGWHQYTVRHEKNGRIYYRMHPNLKLAGTVTGRAACEHPNLQQTTREPRVRSVITAPDGWQLMEFDLSQIELRIAAHLSKDPTMLAVFNAGQDMHWRTAMGEIERAGGGPYVEEIIRAAEMFCVQSKLPPDGASAKALLAVYQANHKRADTRQIIRVASEVWSNQNARSGIGRQSVEGIESVLERRLSDLAVKKVQGDILRSLRRCTELGLAPQKRKSMGLEPIQFADAMSLVSQAGPFSDEEGYSKIWKQLRYNAKAIGFGYIYGMWHTKFRLYARDTYGIELTERQAMESRTSFFSLYSQLEDWHERQRRYVADQGYVRALDGQMRRLAAATKQGDSPERQEAFRQAINAPIQGFAAKINFMILLQMCEEFSWRVFRPIATVHDAILAEVRDDHVEACARRVLEITRRPALFDVLGIHLDVPLEGEVKIGPWGSGVSLDKWLQTRKA
jgi:uracil-DNA glycosylase family 4